jgi:HEAT repeat protein
LWAALRYAPNDPGFHVRCAVLGAFVNLGWKDDARRALVELEEQGALRHWYARAAMSSAVGIAGFKDRLDWVRKILDDSGDARVIAAATEALARLGARDEVKARVDHESPLVRRAALAALQEVGDENAVPLALERIRGDSDAAVRFEAVLVLYRARHPGVDVYLVDALRARNPIFWITALTALERRHGRSFGRDPDAWAAWLKKRRPTEAKN